MINQRFPTADEAVSWYNAWLMTQKPPKSKEGCRECSDEFGGWDPVIKWHTRSGQSVYWYIVGTGSSESLVIEGEETIRGWANQYFYYYAEGHGASAAEAITMLSKLNMKAPPEDLQPSTPESEYWAKVMR